MTSVLGNLLQTFGLNATTKSTPKTTITTKAFTHNDSLLKRDNGDNVDLQSNVGDLPEIPLSIVAQHDDYTDCWIVIYDRVYDVTQFLRDHPGGEDIIVEYAGRDATLAFHGTGHSRAAIEQMGEFLIGELPVNERIFRNTGNGGASNVLTFGVPK